MIYDEPQSGGRIGSGECGSDVGGNCALFDNKSFSILLKFGS